MVSKDFAFLHTNKVCILNIILYNYTVYTLYLKATYLQFFKVWMFDKIIPSIV